MSATERRVSLGFTDQLLPEGQHICYIYMDEAERRHTMSKYLLSGLQAHEKVLYLVDTMAVDEFVEGLREMGVDPGVLGKDLVVQEALPVYCPTGVFSCPDMLDVVGAFHTQSVAEGYTGARGTGEMSWALVDGAARHEDLMEYEARLTEVLARYPSTACCQYDARRFDGGTIMDVLSVHPFMIVRGQVVKNPFFVPPAQFLREFRTRRSGPWHD